MGLFGKKGEKIKKVKGEKELKQEEDSLAGAEGSEIKLELLKEHITALNEKDKAMDERISRISESIGEIREMSMTTEKDMREMEIKAEKSLALIKDLDLEKIHEKLEKNKHELEKQSEMLNNFKETMDILRKTQADFSKKISMIKGADTILELNKEIKKELMTVQKVQAKIERDADRVESIYLTYQKEFSELNDLKEMAKSIDKLQKEIVKEIDDFKIKTTSLAEKKYVEDLRIKQEDMHGKLERFKKVVEQVKKDREKVEFLSKDFEKKVKSYKNINEIEDLNIKFDSFEKRFSETMMALDSHFKNWQKAYQQVIAPAYGKLQQETMASQEIPVSEEEPVREDSPEPLQEEGESEISPDFYKADSGEKEIPEGESPEEKKPTEEKTTEESKEKPDEESEEKSEGEPAREDDEKAKDEGIGEDEDTDEEEEIEEEVAPAVPEKKTPSKEKKPRPLPKKTPAPKITPVQPIKKQVAIPIPVQRIVPPRNFYGMPPMKKRPLRKQFGIFEELAREKNLHQEEASFKDYRSIFNQVLEEKQKKALGPSYMSVEDKLSSEEMLSSLNDTFSLMNQGGYSTLRPFLLKIEKVANEMKQKNLLNHDILNKITSQLIDLMGFYAKEPRLRFEINKSLGRIRFLT